MDSLSTSRYLKIELNDIELVDIFGNAQMLIYLQIGELDVGLTSKGKHTFKNIIGKDNTFSKYD
jgi:hypothetical protein